MRCALLELAFVSMISNLSYIVHIYHGHFEKNQLQFGLAKTLLPFQTSLQFPEPPLLTFPCGLEVSGNFTCAAGGTGAGAAASRAAGAAGTTTSSSGTAFTSTGGATQPRPSPPTSRPAVSVPPPAITLPPGITPPRNIQLPASIRPAGTPVPPSRAPSPGPILTGTTGAAGGTSSASLLSSTSTSSGSSSVSCVNGVCTSAPGTAAGAATAAAPAPEAEMGTEAPSAAAGHGPQLEAELTCQEPVKGALFVEYWAMPRVTAELAEILVAPTPEGPVVPEGPAPAPRRGG